MSAEAYYLEIKQLTTRMRTLVAVFIGMWTVTALLGVLTASENRSGSPITSVFIVTVLIVVIATFFVQAQYFRASRRRKALMREFTDFMNRNGTGRRA